MLAPVCSQPRLRNAAATRQAMLESARRQFARESYENVGLREIAGAVGVDPALVCRYFGSKEALFREVLPHPDDGEFLEGMTAEALPAYLAELLSVPECEVSAEKAEWLLIVMRSAGSPQASKIVREILHEGVLAPVEKMLDAKDAELRAALVLAVMIGSAVLNTMGIETLSDGNSRVREKLAELFAAAIR
ncbi:MAG: TetR family transcriptional regulator [Sphingomonas sp.]|uniref:TetR/AcrR family transcriptional regulator n=1 Tax=Sphingomonas sp. TaxID=28214 RepID=UPI0025CDDDCB|nr:TetR/AcrR family transcriptional regulator [Sphingomonas sp.]MBX3563615.1 TetR family transcriptional regulator [Sphingomonas sp.]